MLAGFEDQSLPALLARADVAIHSLSNIIPELFVGLVRAFEGSDLTKATELHRRVLYLVAIYALSDPGHGSTKLAMKKLGLPLYPTVGGLAPSAPPAFEESIEAPFKTAGLLRVKGEA